MQAGLIPLTARFVIRVCGLRWLTARCVNRVSESKSLTARSVNRVCANKISTARRGRHGGAPGVGGAAQRSELGHQAGRGLQRVMTWCNRVVDPHGRQCSPHDQGSHAGIGRVIEATGKRKGTEKHGTQTKWHGDSVCLFAAWTWRPDGPGRARRAPPNTPQGWGAAQARFPHPVGQDTRTEASHTHTHKWERDRAGAEKEEAQGGGAPRNQNRGQVHEVAQMQSPRKGCPVSVSVCVYT